MSKSIISRNYDKSTKTLELIFGYDAEKVYIYPNVPVKVWNGLEKAESKGKFFHAHIRPKYKATSEYR